MRRKFEFQTLIGSVRTGKGSPAGAIFWLFQTLIGSVRTLAGGDGDETEVRVSNPHR